MEAIMTNAQPFKDTSKVEDIPLENIEKLLEAEDPGFTKSLEEVRAVETDKSVEIQATELGDHFVIEDRADEKIDPGTSTFLQKIKMQLRELWFVFRLRVKNRIILFWCDALIFLKGQPRELALYGFATFKVFIKSAKIPLKAFSGASRKRRFAFLALGIFFVATLGVLLANMKGVWLPPLHPPILKSFGEHAEWRETYDPREEGESFYQAFPQERHEFLFKILKVNLKRPSENANPMGAFEIIVLLDSEDTAIEVHDREVELYDAVQRVVEEETYADLESEAGKGRLKSRLRREMNSKLTQGWVKDVSFKTFIIKP
jgi:flagellar basal body-associated protein FliL